MTNTQIIILLAILILIYLYWKSQQNSLPRNKTDFTENEVFFEAMDSESEAETELPAEQQDWFSEQHWLSDQEIDWALARVIEDLPTERQTKYKFLESTQFMFAKETLELKDAQARDSFPVLLSELTGFTGELVFIPVNNPDFHWSCLVYEVQSKKFYHFDTLKGANDSYLRPLVKELLSQLLQTNEPNLKDYLATRYHLKQGNTWDCGVAVIEIMKAISKDYPTYQRILLYTKLDFDFAQAREDWRQRFLPK